MTRYFGKWAASEGLSHEALTTAVAEIEDGLVDAQLGGNLVKKRVAIPGRGKRGSTRTILAVKTGQCAFYIYGYAKNARANISRDELKGLKMLAKELLGYEGKVLGQALSSGALVEVK